MSRFWGSDDESDGSGSGDDVDAKPMAKQTRVGQVMMDENSDSDTGQRVIKTDREKKLDAMKAMCKAIRNHIKISDWNAIRRDFDELNERLEKAASIVKKEGTPVFYFQIVKAIDDFSVTAKLNKKELSSTNAKSMTILTQKLKKLKDSIKENYTKFLASPAAEKDGTDEEEELDDDESGSGSEDDDDGADGESDEDEEKPKKRSKKRKESDDEGSDSDEDIEDIKAGRFPRSFWVKKEDAETPEQREERRRKEDAERRKEKEEAAKLKKVEEQVTAAGKVDTKRIDLTPQLIRQKLKEISLQRGKRGTDRAALLQELKTLREASVKEVALMLKIQIILVSATLDLNLNTGMALKAEHWKSALAEIVNIVDVVSSNRLVRLTEDEIADGSTAFALNEAETMPLPAEEDKEEEEKSTAASVASTPVSTPAAAGSPVAEEDDDIVVRDGIEYVAGNLYAFVLRLCDEFTKALQQSDPNSSEYIARLRDEAALERLLETVRGYYALIGSTRSECMTAWLALEFAYYKYDPAFDHQLKSPVAGAASSSTTTPLVGMLGPKPLVTMANVGPAGVLSNLPVLSQSAALAAAPHPVHTLASFIYAHGDQRTKTRALLCHIYWLARHAYFTEARDVLLMTHVSDSIHLSDISTKTLYNRCMAQVGLCAFRHGQIRTAFHALSDLHSTAQTKRLLAQGLNQRYDDRVSEQEKAAERLRQMPFHMHINVDMLDGVHLICAMLLEVPNLAVHSAEDKKFLISKQFRRHFEVYQRQVFSGPPENTREYVMAASSALVAGDWTKVAAHVFALKMWEFMPCGTTVKAMLTQKIQEEALRTYLFSYASGLSARQQCFSTLSLPALATKFSLSEKHVYRLVSRAILNEELPASWDQPSNCLILQPAQTNSGLQRAALRYADKLSVLVEQNERLADHDKKDGRSGPPGFMGGDRRGGGGRPFERRAGTGAFGGRSFGSRGGYHGGAQATAAGGH